MMARHEAEGTTDHPEYQGAVNILNYRHLCRLDEWPAPVQRSLSGINMDIYGSMWGPNEFTCTGNLKHWDRLADLHRIQQPSLVLCGLHDELTPDSAARIHRGLKNSASRSSRIVRTRHFSRSRGVFFERWRAFLDAHRGELASTRGGTRMAS